MTHSRQLLTTMTTLGGLFAAIPVNAQSLCGEETCPVGYTCEVQSYDNCAWDCDDSEEGRGDCAPTNCETEEYAYCQRAACETDADCGGELLCHTFVQATCPASPACPPGQDCQVDMPTGCTQEEFKQCTPRAELPCDTASDCGQGYDCVEAVSCTCTGGGMAPSEGTEAPAGQPTMGSGGGASPGAAPAPSQPDVDAPVTPDPVQMPAPPPDSCDCNPSGINYCQLQQIACATDADCPATFNCIASPGSCWQDSEGNSGCTEGTSQCYPASEPGGGGMNPSDPTGGPTPAPQGDSEGTDEGAEAPIRDDASEPNDSDEANESGSLGGLFALWGCSLQSTAGQAASHSWYWLTAGVASLLLRRRRR